MSTNLNIKELFFLDRFVFGVREDENEHHDMRPTALPAVMVPAMAYVPLQFYDTIFDTEEGFNCGTVFPELVKPFTGSDRR